LRKSIHRCSLSTNVRELNLRSSDEREFDGVFQDRMSKGRKPASALAASEDATQRAVLSLKKHPADLTIAEIVGSLNVVQLWAVLGAIVVVIGGAFAAGKLFGHN
jgi:hypothetical protein